MLALIGTLALVVILFLSKAVIGHVVGHLFVGWIRRKLGLNRTSRAVDTENERE